MVDLSLRQRSSRYSWRCPWCHEGERPGEDWQLCPRDQAPIHCACVAEYQACPLCRERLTGDQSPAPREEPSAIHEDEESPTAEWPRALQGSLQAPIYPELDASSRALLLGMLRESLTPSLRTFLFIASYVCVVILVIRWLSDWLGGALSIPCYLGYLWLLLWRIQDSRARSLAAQSTPKALQELAEQLTLGDRRAIAAWKSWRRARRRLEHGHVALRNLKRRALGPSTELPLMDFLEEARWSQGGAGPASPRTLQRLEALKRGLIEDHRTAELALEVLASWSMERPRLQKELEKSA